MIQKRKIKKSKKKNKNKKKILKFRSPKKSKKVLQI